MQNESRKKTKLVRKHPSTWRLVLGVGLLLFGAWIVFSSVGTNSDRKAVVINGRRLYVEVADEQDEITLGLGERDSLAEDSGMLFIMPEPIIPNFWMKDMRFPIDFVWIDEEMKIIAVTPSIGADSYPITFSPPSKVKYVLEVNAGLSAHNAWLPGDNVEITPP